MKDFENKTAVVTGAAGGIGKALALEFARRGMRLVLADIEEGALLSAQAEVEAAGAEVLAKVTDVSRLNSVIDLADAAFERFGAVHVLCNNAGVSAGGVAVADLSHQDWEWVLGVNLWGVIHGLEAFLPRMIAGEQGGHIVNTASILGHATWRNSAPYTATKFAVVGLSESLALEISAKGLGVSVLCPVFVETGIFESERNRPDQYKVNRERVDVKAYVKNIGGVWLKPDEVGRVVLQAIEEERFYIFTHPETADYIDSRQERIRKAYPEDNQPLDN